MTRVTVTVLYADGHKCDFHVAADRVAAVRRGAEREGGEVVSVESFTDDRFANLLADMLRPR